MKRVLILEIDPDEKYVRITDGEGHETLLESVAVIGGDADNNRLLIQMYGSSSDAAWAFGQGFLHSLQEKNQGSALTNFYRQAALHCVMMASGQQEEEPWH